MCWLGSKTLLIRYRYKRLTLRPRRSRNIKRVDSKMFENITKKEIPKSDKISGQFKTGKP